MSAAHNDPWDDFWDDPPIKSTDGTEILPGDTLDYGDVLREFFPRGDTFSGWARRPVASGGDMPLACTILGSHLVGVGSKDGGASWSALWQQTIGTFPIPRIDWTRLRPAIPSTATMATKKCRDPKDFRLWLNFVASKILQTAIKQIIEGVHPDNWLPTPQYPRLALQAANDIHQIGADDDLVYQASPALPWTSVGNGFKCHVLRKGEPRGFIALGIKNGRWRYGAEIQTDVIRPNNPPLTFKHEAPASLRLDQVDEAKRAAERLYFIKTYHWLVQLGLNRPELREASR